MSPGHPYPTSDPLVMGRPVHSGVRDKTPRPYPNRAPQQTPHPAMGAVDIRTGGIPRPGLPTSNASFGAQFGGFTAADPSPQEFRTPGHPLGRPLGGPFGGGPFGGGPLEGMLREADTQGGSFAGRRLMMPEWEGAGTPLAMGPGGVWGSHRGGESSGPFGGVDIRAGPLGGIMGLGGQLPLPGFPLLQIPVLRANGAVEVMGARVDDQIGLGQMDHRLSVPAPVPAPVRAPYPIRDPRRRPDAPRPDAGLGVTPPAWGARTPTLDPSLDPSPDRGMNGGVLQGRVYQPSQTPILGRIYEGRPLLGMGQQYQPEQYQQWQVPVLMQRGALPSLEGGYARRGSAEQLPGYGTAPLPGAVRPLAYPYMPQGGQFMAASNPPGAPPRGLADVGQPLTSVVAAEGGLLAADGGGGGSPVPMLAAGCRPNGAFPMGDYSPVTGGGALLPTPSAEFLPSGAFPAGGYSPGGSRGPGILQAGQSAPTASGPDLGPASVLGTGAGEVPAAGHQTGGLMPGLGGSEAMSALAFLDSLLGTPPGGIPKNGVFGGLGGPGSPGSPEDLAPKKSEYESVSKLYRTHTCFDRGLPAWISAGIQYSSLLRCCCCQMFVHALNHKFPLQEVRFFPPSSPLTGERREGRGGRSLFGM